MSTTLGVFHQKRKTEEDIVRTGHTGEWFEESREEEEEVGENRMIFVNMFFVACC
jgi:hypothetical protein